MHIYVYADTHNVYPEIFVIIFSRGSRVPTNIYLHAKVLQGSNFALYLDWFSSLYARVCMFDRSAIIQVRDGGRDRTHTPKRQLCFWLPFLLRDMGSSCW